MPINHPRDIPSAITDREADALTALASQDVVLEVGADRGFSTVVLARAARQVHSVDWFRGDPHAGYHDSLSEYWTNLGRYAVRDKVIVHIGAAHDVFDWFGSAVFDGAFIDAYHEEDAVFADAIAVRPLVTEWIAFHDYGRFTVKPAVDRFVEDKEASLEVIDTLAIVRFWR